MTRVNFVLCNFFFLCNIINKYCILGLKQYNFFFVCNMYILLYFYNCILGPEQYLPSISCSVVDPDLSDP
jgi:hypothetical protein